MNNATEAKEISYRVNINEFKQKIYRRVLEKKVNAKIDIKYLTRTTLHEKKLSMSVRIKVDDINYLYGSLYQLNGIKDVEMFSEVIKNTIDSYQEIVKNNIIYKGFFKAQKKLKKYYQSGIESSCNTDRENAILRAYLSTGMRAEMAFKKYCELR